MSENVIFIVDNSLSVSQYTEPYINVINNTISSLRPDTLVSLILFNEVTKYIFINKSVKTTQPITINDISPQGLTSFYDNLSTILIHMGNFFKSNKQKPPIVIILTDGEDTSSKKLNFNQTALQVARNKLKGWKFIYLGISEDSMKHGKILGFNVCILYETVKKCFSSIPILISQLIEKKIEKDIDIDLREITNSMQILNMYD